MHGVRSCSCWAFFHSVFEFVSFNKIPAKIRICKVFVKLESSIIMIYCQVFFMLSIICNHLVFKTFENCLKLRATDKSN